MFTGLIEEVGKVVKISRNHQQINLGISLPKIYEKIKVGDSICINGVCLTVASIGCRENLHFDIMALTQSRTNLHLLHIGDRVNAERAMVNDGRLDGHIVTGHADGMGRILSVTPEGACRLITVLLPKEIASGFFPLASMAVDGVSLTIQRCSGRKLVFSIVQHTFNHTTLQFARPGRFVNLEIDYLIKAIYHRKEVN